MFIVFLGEIDLGLANPRVHTFWVRADAFRHPAVVYSTTTRTIKSSLLIGAAVIIALCSGAPAAAARAAHIIVGGWRLIKDVKDPHIQELGGWAVSEHVRQANDGLRFGRVVSGDEQVVSGMNYMLLIEATNGAGKSATYGAAVYEQEWTKTRKLLAFAAAN